MRIVKIQTILKPLLVGETFSVKVPRSSAEVRRVFVHHIVEVEVV